MTKLTASDNSLNRTFELIYQVIDKRGVTEFCYNSVVDNFFHDKFF